MISFTTLTYHDNFCFELSKKNKSCGLNAYFLNDIVEKLIILKNIINNIIC